MKKRTSSNNLFYSFDRSFITFCKKYYSTIGRAALFVIFFYFGFLKIVGLSPADALAIGFAQKMGVGMYAQQLYIALAYIECLIGILILFPRFTRIAILIMLLHLILVCSPLILYSDVIWVRPFVPSLEGQYIIKNAALVALALGLVAGTQPLTRKKH